MNRLEEIVKTLKTYIAEGVEVALDYLEKILDHNSLRYNDFIQIKSRYKSLQRELLLGVLDHSTYDISRNNISKALLILAEEIAEKDLVPEDGGKSQEVDKRGEVLYNIPDVMQQGREEKCTVRIAFDIEHLKEGWVDSAEDVIKAIRVSEIMAVSLLNVDESDPPFAIRTFSETVQFVDKDDFTEWVFYVKPIKIGQYPLVMRVSVIEMINNKEYKKDIVLEEKIIVQAEEVPPSEAEFKSAGTSITVTNNPLPPEQMPPPASQAQDAASRGARSLAGALLKGVAIAAVTIVSIYTGVKVYNEVGQNRKDEKAWKGTRERGDKNAFEDYLKEFPNGAHSEEAQHILDSLNNATSAPLQDSVTTETLPPSSVPTDLATKEEVPSKTSPGSNESDATKTPTLPPSGTDKPNRPPADPPSNTTSKDTNQKPAPDKDKETKSTPANSGDKAPTNQPNPQPNPPNNAPPPNDPPPVESKLLRGDNFYFRIPRFPIVEGEKQNMFFTFYQFNQFQEVLILLGSLGEARMTPGMKLAFVPEKGADLVAELKYVATTPKVENRMDGYFTLDEAQMKSLAAERIKSVRLLNESGQVLKTYALTSRGSRDLNRRAADAVKKMYE
ncbi:MAG: hypothetical protein KIS77_02195 [Saprospiraceae bacterium]|nr:hypothetical protein [Saprospiraceae bacterium]